MGAEHSQQRLETDGHEILTGVTTAAGPRKTVKQRTIRQNTAGTSSSSRAENRQGIVDSSPSPLSRAPSPPLSVCSDLPYVSYTDRPIGENSSPKLKNKALTAAARATPSQRKAVYTGAKPKRPQTQSSHIVVVKPGVRDNDEEIDPDLARLRSIPHFLPILRDSVNSGTFTRDPEALEKLQSQHLLNICSRVQVHLNLCASHVAGEQNHLVERTKVVSNSITTLFASFVDMQKTYASYAEQFTKIRGISQQLSRCNSLLNENIESIEAINNFLDIEDRLEPFVWRTDDNKLRGRAEGAMASSSTLIRRNE